MTLSKELKTSIKNTLKVTRTAFAGIAIAVLLAMFNDENPGFIGSNPHPYLFISILIGATLGLRGSLMVSPVLSAAYFYFLNQRVDKLAVEYFFSFENVLLPFSFVLFAAIVGAISGNLRRNIISLMDDNDGRKRIIGDLEEMNESLRTEKLRMETKIASQSQTVSRVLEYAKIFDSMEMSRITDGAVELVCEYLGENSCYVYLYDGDVLKRAAFKDPGIKTLPSEINKSQYDYYPLIKNAIDSRKTCGIESVNLKALPKDSEYHGLCTPIIYGHDIVAGVIYVRKMKFMNYVSSSYLTFDSVGQWIGSSIAKVKHVHHVRESSFVDEVTGLFTYSYFQKRIMAEFGKARRHGLKLNVLKFSLQDISDHTATKKIMLMKLLSHSVDVFRFNCDAVTLNENGNGVYAIMSVVDQEEVEDFRKNVIREFTEVMGAVKGFEKLKLNVTCAELKQAHRSIEDTMSDFREPNL